MSTHPQPASSSAIELRLRTLERRASRAQALAVLACIALAVSATTAFTATRRQVDEVERLRVRRLELVDDAGVVRLVLGQDPKDGSRRSRAAGLVVLDRTGRERGGFSTMDDGSVVLALDAPEGVGHPMPDRVGLVVYPDGSAHVMLLDNETRAVAKLHSDGRGGGGVQVFDWDMEAKQVRVKTLTYEGEERETLPIGG
jgi:hypothetical protein